MTKPYAYIVHLICAAGLDFDNTRTRTLYMYVYFKYRSFKKMVIALLLNTG